MAKKPKKRKELGTSSGGGLLEGKHNISNRRGNGENLDEGYVKGLAD